MLAAECTDQTDLVEHDMVEIMQFLYTNKHVYSLHM